MKRADPEEIIRFFEGTMDCLFIVEGKKDVKALNTLGITNILAINGRTLIAIVDAVASLREEPLPVPRDGRQSQRHSDIIILTDFDREGRHIAGKLDALLRSRKLHANQRLRSRIMEFGFNRIEDIRLDSVKASGKRKRKGMP